MERERIIAYGAGNFFINHIEDLRRRFDIECVVDGDIEKNNKILGGVRCVNPIEISAYKGLRVAVTTINDAFRNEIRTQLKSEGFQECDVFNLSNDAEQKYVVFGTIDDCRDIDVALSLRNDCVVEVYCTDDYQRIGIDKISNKKVCSYIKAQKCIKDGDVDAMIISKNKASFCFCSEFFSADTKDKCLIFDGNMDDQGKYKLTPIHSYRRLSDLQFMISPACNLNCKLCSHFSPLVEDVSYYDFEKFTNDLLRMKTFVDEIDSIDLWGGETLLCQDLYKYIYKTREVFPDSSIHVGTNGLLLKKIDDSLIDAMKDTNSIFCISLYPVLEDFDDVLLNLRNLGIGFFTGYEHLTSDPKRQTFFRRYDISGNNQSDEAWDFCTSKTCHTIYEGKISGCYFPITAPIFNQYFKHEYFITEQDIIDLYDDDLTTEKLLLRLRSPMKSCRYCHLPIYEKWERLGKKSVLSDWIIGENDHE